MNKKHLLYGIFALILFIFSCNNKKFEEKPVFDLEITNINLKPLFDELNQNAPPEKMPLEYYRDIILKDETSRRYLELNNIMEIDYLIPGLLCFIVHWTDFEGYVYKLYTFNDKHQIVDIYSCGNGFPMPYNEILTQNISGIKFADYLIISDINDDGINELITFTFWNFPIFGIYGFDMVENKFKPYLETEYYFNYDEPFAPIKVEKNNGNNEIIILRIVNKETYDLQWTKYIFDNERRIYKIKNIEYGGTLPNRKLGEIGFELVDKIIKNK
ncbi:hypothetical protein FACS1894109_06970 [Spirochaetia bacterium]|nr:hypothetical protein FACS1894109_06970 [Spirochaetia bacterium]